MAIRVAHDLIVEHYAMALPWLMNRNDPCFCGSGRKFKKCHGAPATPVAADESLSIVRRSEIARASACKQMDMQLVNALMQYAQRHLDRNWLTRAATQFSFDHLPDLATEELELFGPWMLYHMPISDTDPMPLAWRYQESQRLHREPAKHRLVEAQLASLIGVWEVQSVERGVGPQIKDLLTGRERFVYDAASSQTLQPWIALLGYVVDVDDISFFGGIHTRPLPPAEVAIVVRETRKAARVRTRPVPDEFLGASDRQLDLIDEWRLAIERMDHAMDSLQLVNSHGEDVSIQTDRFDIVGPREVVLRRLADVPGAEPPEREGSRDIITVLDSASSAASPVASPIASATFGMTIVGQIIVAGKALTIETNSVARADALKSAVEAAAGVAVRYRLRSSESMASIRARASDGVATGRKSAAPAKNVFTSMDDMPPEVREAVRQMMAKYDAEWPETPVPALGNVTPRAAATDKTLRPKLIALLKDMEVRQGARTDGSGMDIAAIRLDLGL